MFATRLIEWQRAHGRHDLPWQGTRDPYRIWLSEVMLQQTQVATVIPYYLRFVARFPDVGSLAAADVDEVMRLWSGLGYYSRARNLHRCAREVADAHGGAFPGSAAELARLPGIGRSTAAAIAAFAFGERAAILDGNVRRVLCRYFGVAGWPGERAVEAELWRIAERELPPSDVGTYTQAQMDLGATVCTRAKPRCAECPLREGCNALATGRTATLPAPRPRAPRPLRETALMVLRRGAEVLLEKRPPAGIWGGLWSLPELDPGLAAGAADEALRRYGARVRAAEPLAVLTHEFTHFTLRAQPLLLEVESLRGGAAEAGTVWLPLDEAPDAALPAPVRRLLASLVNPG